MAHYIVRVELVQGAGIQEYEALHEIMATEQFRRYIVGQRPSGVYDTVTLPTAMYSGESALDPSSLANMLQRIIVASLWPKTAVLTMQVGLAWALNGTDLL